MKTSQILVLNCGSSSLKFSLINPKSGQSLLSGIAERLTTPRADITIKFDDNKHQAPVKSPYGHQQAIDALVQILKDNELIELIVAVGHRVVHGGEKFSAPTLITNSVKQTIAELSQLAPLHNPANLVGIEAAEQCFTNLPQVAIFDTAFHQTMPKENFIYGLPYALYEQQAIRKYGFHGTSHYFVANQVANEIQKNINKCHFITAHLGNGCSVTAIKNGKSVDSSMGFTPLEGVMMGTRSGSIDPGIIFHLIEHLGYSPEQVNQLMNKQSGLLGVSGLSNDCRELEQAMNEGHELATLALAIFSNKIAKSIAAMATNLPRIDAIIFTGGIGENSAFIRQSIAKNLSLLSLAIDTQKNEQIIRGKHGNIADSNSIQCWVMPTNEEWVIAQQTFQLLNKD